MTLPTLNMAGWTIVDFEIAFEGLQALDYAANAMANQPRSQRSNDLRPGADFIETVRVEWVHFRIDELVNHLAKVRFADPRDDDRRVCLLVRHHADGLLPAMELVALAERERAKAA